MWAIAGDEGITDVDEGKDACTCEGKDETLNYGKLSKDEDGYGST